MINISFLALFWGCCAWSGYVLSAATVWAVQTLSHYWPANYLSAVQSAVQGSAVALTSPEFEPCKVLRIDFQRITKVLYKVALEP